MKQSIPERFEKIVGRYPERLAAKTRDRSLSYKELNEASNRIAHALLTQRGPGNDSVALLLIRGRRHRWNVGALKEASYLV
jgi:non-ribosomal peptide synthetase component F